MKTVTVKNGERYGRLVVIKEVEPRLRYKKGKIITPPKLIAAFKNR